jgi:hypothetical protein
VAIEHDLKIFISWSGLLAKEVTRALKAWLPKMFDHIDPWASDTDIHAGTRGLDAIQARLNESSFGIIVVTAENMEKPWLNFEAGALSKSLDGDITKVIPLLVGFDNIEQLRTSPLNQFQATVLDKAGMQKVCRSIAAAIGLDLLTIEDRYDWAWPDLEKRIAKANEDAGNQPKLPEPDEKDLLRDLLTSVRNLERAQSAAFTRSSRPLAWRSTRVPGSLSTLGGTNPMRTIDGNSIVIVTHPRADDDGEKLDHVKRLIKDLTIPVSSIEIKQNEDEADDAPPTVVIVLRRPISKSRRTDLLKHLGEQGLHEVRIVPPPDSSS